MAEVEERGWDTPTQPPLPRRQGAFRHHKAGVEFDLPLEEVIQCASIHEDPMKRDEDGPRHRSILPRESANSMSQPSQDVGALLGALLAYLLVVATLTILIALVIWVVVQLATFILGCIAGVVLLALFFGGLAHR